MDAWKAGAADLERTAAALAARIPAELSGLARLAYNYRWSWAVGGPRLFRAIDPHLWEVCSENPVRMLWEADATTLAAAASDEQVRARTAELVDLLDRDVAREADGDRAHPVAFLCTEFAIHRSLPIYSGGLGVLAGDILKEASDGARPYVGVGLLYRQGYFRQRLDPSGWQHEYWTEERPERLPAALVTGTDGAPLTVTVPIHGREVVVQVWRVEVGRVPLFLLDAQRRENALVDRWITSRLYVSDRRLRLGQYALLGIGGVRVLQALGIEPSTYHLNEGHVAMAPLEVTRRLVSEGRAFPEALASARTATVFTTHTPIAAGNEAFTPREIADVLGTLPADLGVDLKEVLALGRAHPDDADEPFGMTPLGLRGSAAANGVSRIHGGVARAMWRHLYDQAEHDEQVPIGHVTNGVHLPTWMAPAMRALLGRTLGPGWEARASDGLWAALDSIDDAELWEVRGILRRELLAYARERAATDRLGRGEPVAYVEQALHAFDPDVLTIGFARRAAAYKRLYLLTHDPERALRMLEGERSVQMLLAGKPHPQDEEGKRIVQGVFELKWAPHVSERVAFLEDYDLGLASRLVSGCDVWVNVPRPPLEACGTSGMKAGMNGCINLSVLDGWWDEAYDGTNGWAINAHVGNDHAALDAQDANALYDLLEQQVIPAFYDRDPDGVPRAWVQRMRASIRSVALGFNAGRMLADYRARMYP